MSLALRIALAVLFVSVLIDSRGKLIAQTDVSTVESLDNQNEAARNLATATADNGRFPSIHGREVFVLSRSNLTKRFGFAWIKFSIVILASFIWLREMRLCVDDGNQHQLQVDSWGKALFAIGLAGILTAIFLPAYLLGTCVLVASCGVPFWRFICWRNAQVGSQTPRLGWGHLFVSPAIPFRSLPDT